MKLKRSIAGTPRMNCYGQFVAAPLPLLQSRVDSLRQPCTVWLPLLRILVGFADTITVSMLPDAMDHQRHASMQHFSFQGTDELREFKQIADCAVGYVGGGGGGCAALACSQPPGASHAKFEPSPTRKCTINGTMGTLYSV